MKKRIKKFLYSSLIAFVSMEISFNTEARLPKYMAQRAAELLIEKSGLQLKSTTLINDDYLKLKENVILFSIASALPKYTVDDNVQNFLTSIIKNMNQAKCEHKTEIKRFTEAISNENIQSRLIVAIQTLDKADEQFTEQVAIALKDAIIANERAIYGHKLVEFLYTTEKRQHLANWMKRRLPFKVHGTLVSWKEDENDFKNLLDDINEAFNDTEVFRTFVNQHFPCWTGTMTCFMMPNSLAYNMLISNNLVQVTKASLHQGTNCEKVIRLLFILELVDTWDDIKGIVDKQEEPIPELSTAYDPYDCVPVPNTAYFIPHNRWPQGSCMVSTIRNLLYILCRDSQNSTEIITNNMDDDVRAEFSEPIYYIPGTTSLATLEAFANAILPEVTNEYKPDLALFTYTLYALLKEKILITPLPTPKEYLNKVVPAELIKVILRKISNHDIEVEVNNNPSKLTRTWPEEYLIISDKNVKKKVTIAFGQCGSGAHIEIINIETLQTD